jgi:hypothetical protein
MTKPFITVEGDEQTKQMFATLPRAFGNGVMREIARKGGRVIVKRVRVQITGTLGSQIKKDVGVVRSRRDKNGVEVKMRGKSYPGRDGKDRNVISIARHLTEGFKQKDRKTKGKGKRGRVKQRHSDFIKDAGKSGKNEAIEVMKRESVDVAKKHVAKWQRRLR